MQVRRWTTDQLLVGLLLLLLLVSPSALAQAPVPVPVAAAERSAVSISTDLTTSPLLQKISDRMRGRDYRLEIDEVLEENGMEIEREIAAGGVRLAQYLTDHGAYGMNILHWMFLATRNGRDDLVPYFREHCGDPKSAHDERGRTPLHVAGSPEEAKYLLAQGLDVNRRDREGRPPLECALFGWHTADELGGNLPPPNYPLARFLLSHGADPNPVSDLGRSLLARTVCEGFGCYRVLLENGANPNAKDRFGRTAVFDASDTSAVLTLQEFGGDLRVRDLGGQTALFAPAGPDKVDTLIKAGCRLEDRALDGKTPLLAVAATGDMKAVSVLLERGANLAAVDKLGRGVLHFCMAWDLLEKGADAGVRSIYGQTPLHYFVPFAGGSAEPMGSIENIGRLPVLDRPEVRATINVKDNHGRTVLHWLVWRGNRAADLTYRLVALGADVNARDELGQTPLDYAHMVRAKKIESLLREKGGVAGTTATAVVDGQGTSADPFAFVRDVARRDYRSDEAPGDTDDLGLFANFADLNNDGCFDLRISCDRFRSRSGFDWTLVLGMPDGRFRLPTNGDTDGPDAKPVGLFGWDFDEPVSLGIGHGLFSVFEGRQSGHSTTWYRIDGYTVREISSVGSRYW